MLDSVSVLNCSVLVTRLYACIHLEGKGIIFIMFQVHFTIRAGWSVLLAWQLQRFYPAWILRKRKILCHKSTNDTSHSWQTRNTFYISQCSSSSLGNHKCTRYPKLCDSKLNCRGCFPRRTDGTISGDDPKFRYRKILGKKLSLQMWLLCHSTLRSKESLRSPNSLKSSVAPIPRGQNSATAKDLRIVPKLYR